MGAALLLLASLLAFDDPPKDVIEFFRSAAADLANAHSPQAGAAPDASAFLGRFDPAMPGYEKFRDQVQAMVAAGDVGDVIDFVSDEGDAKRRTLQLDWVLEFEGEPPKRAVIKCTIEKRGKKWKITALDPIEFFKRD